MLDEMNAVAMQADAELNKSATSKTALPVQAVSVLTKALTEAIAAMGGGVTLPTPAPGPMSPELVRAIGLVRAAAEKAGLPLPSEEVTNSLQATMLAGAISRLAKDPKFVEAMKAPPSASAAPAEMPAEAEPMLEGDMRSKFMARMGK